MAGRIPTAWRLFRLSFVTRRGFFLPVAESDPLLFRFLDTSHEADNGRWRCVDEHYRFSRVRHERRLCTIHAPCEHLAFLCE